jgi:predicted transcriptional regulator
VRSPRATRGRRKHKAPNRQELATIKALENVGMTPYAIGKRTGLNHKTVAKYLKDQEAYADPSMAALVEKILEKEILDLTVLTVKSRARLHEIVDRMNPIEALALMDRSFQQRRLLEGKSTQNISTLSKIIKEANKDLED